MSDSLTESFVTFATGIGEHNIPDAAVRAVRTGFTDGVAAMVAGLAEPVADVLLRTVRAAGGAPQSRIALREERAPAPEAALVGAASAHALDFDDYAFSCHPSAVMVPAILAEAEVAGASGADMVSAYVAGYEIWAKLMSREPGHLHTKGWHPTGVFGPVAVAAAIAVLGRFDADTTRHAVGIAASHSSGVMANFGTMTKPYHAGRAAQGGIVAARLAANGLSAGDRAVDAPNGLLAALSPAGAVDLETPMTTLGRDWYIERHGVNVKKYPMVGASQRCIDAALQLKTDHGIEAARIARIVARVSPRYAEVMPFHAPATGLQAKFSLEFALASAFLTGRVGLGEVTDSFVQRDDVQRLMRRVEIERSADDDPLYANGARADLVTACMDDGAVLVSDEVTRARGHGLVPLSADELWAKFADCTRERLSDRESRALFEVLQRIETLDSAAEIPSVPA